MIVAPVALTAAGRIRGAVEDGVEVFKGIRYGAPTGGEDRFRAPRPPEPWDRELDATSYGHSCPQWSLFPDVAPDVGALLAERDTTPPPGTSEDCLFLNVWTPQSGGDGRRPVMVWLHGGGWTAGSGSSSQNRGTRLAQRGDVVVVTLNHRLGVFGFLELAELDGDEFADSGNVGMLDIVAALEWIRDNIAAFGGDASNVTIFGCSGGGGKVAMLLAMPVARGLFHKAIIESGPTVEAISFEESTATATSVLAHLGVKPSEVKALRDLPASDLIAAQTAVMPDLLARLLANGDGPQLGPTVDGRSLPVHPFDPVAAPTAAEIPLIIGANKDELAVMAAMIPGFREAEDDYHLGIVRAFARNNFEQVLAAYRSTMPNASTADLAIAAMSAPTRAASITIAERKLSGGSAPVFVYLFAYETDALGGQLKAAHGFEVPFVFNVADEVPTAGTWDGVKGLSDAMADAWIAFARTGNPSHSGLPGWPEYDLERRATMIFDRRCRVDDDPYSLERRIWDGARIRME